MKFRIIILLFFVSLVNLQGQNIIKIDNSGFDKPLADEKGEDNWFFCNEAHNFYSGAQITENPENDNAYLVLLTSSDSSWAAITQKLKGTLKADQVYSFQAYLAHLVSFSERSLTNNETTNYDRPISLKVWGGSAPCERRELLSSTEIVDHREWLNYEFLLYPQSEISYITLEAAYKVPSLFPYDGNLAIDDLSQIDRIITDDQLDTTLSIAEMEELVLYGPFDEVLEAEPEANFVNIRLIRDIYSFEERMSENGVKHFVESSSIDALKTQIRKLEYLHFQNTTPVFKKIANLSVKLRNGTVLDAEEKTFFDNCNKVFEEKMKLDDLNTIVYNFIKRNKMQFLRELARAKQP